MLSVAEFMHHDAVQHFAGCQHEQAVKVEVAFGGAAAPYGFLVTDGDPAVSNTDDPGIISYSLRDHSFGFQCQPLYLFKGELWKSV